jgi:hypothetical protein
MGKEEHWMKVGCEGIKRFLRFLLGRGERLSGAKAGEGKESQFCMGELESKNLCISSPLW